MEATGSGTLSTTLPTNPSVIRKRCSGCGRCVAACSKKLITLEAIGHRKFAIITDGSRCSSCDRCAGACLLDAIALPPES